MISEIEPISNVALVLSALHQLGGGEKFIDIEEVAISAFQLSPRRFAWRTRRDLPSWERVRTAFVHANQQERRRGRPPLVIQNTTGTAWRLTADGVAFVQSNAQRLGGPVPDQRRTGKSAERVRRIRGHTTFLAFSNGTPIEDLKRYQLADLLLCPPDSSIDSVRRKLDTARAAALEQRDGAVTKFLAYLDKVLTEKWA
jgi:hypothetical protein